MDDNCKCENCGCEKNDHQTEKSPEDKVEEMKRSIEDLGFKVEDEPDGETRVSE